MNPPGSASLPTCGGIARRTASRPEPIGTSSTATGVGLTYVIEAQALHARGNGCVRSKRWPQYEQWEFLRCRTGPPVVVTRGRHILHRAPPARCNLSEVSADPAELDFLDASERELVRESLVVIEESEPAQAALLRGNLARLASAADLVQKSPSVLSDVDARRFARESGESLLDLLCQVPDWDFDLQVPVRVIFGQSYLIAKINFLKAMVERTEWELAQSIYSKLAEELFVSIATDARGERRLKAAAAQSLIRIWEDRLHREIDDFAPVLESVWRARNKVRPVIGTTLGTHEFFRLLGECSDTSFLEYFAQEVPAEQVQAFEEFLFGLSWEQLSTLRERMQAEQKSAVSDEQARAALSRPESWAPRQDGAQAFYTSYKKRRLKAQYRVLTQAPGPHKTAEEFVMSAFLMREAG